MPSEKPVQIEKLLKAYDELKSLLQEMGVLSQENTAAAPLSSQGRINLPSGPFSIEELTYLLNTLLIDITFVDKNDEVRYFSEGKERIFLRT